MKAIKHTVCVRVEFAESNGVLNTREGAVSYRQGDAMMTGPSGERWPISRQRFEATYEPATSALGQGWYCKRPLVVDARQAISEERVHLRRGEGVLQARPGDWVVTAPDGGQWVVEQDIFAQTYALLDQADG